MFSNNNDSRTIWVGLSFLVLGLTLGLLFSQGQNPLGSETSEPQSYQEAVDQLDPDKLTQVEVSEDDDAVLGDPDAPITVVEFGDLQCPRCYEFHRDVMPLIQEKYIGSGMVKWVYRDFPLDKHPQADTAALAAECTRAQYTGQPGYSSKDEFYFAMFDLITDHIMDWSGQADTAEATFVSLAKDELGVDIQSCMDAETYKEDIEGDYTAGRSYGVEGTPTFFINGRKLIGSWPFEAFEKVIEAQMKNE